MKEDEGDPGLEEARALLAAASATPLPAAPRPPPAPATRPPPPRDPRNDEDDEDSGLEEARQLLAAAAAVGTSLPRPTVAPPARPWDRGEPNGPAVEAPIAPLPAGGGLHQRSVASRYLTAAAAAPKPATPLLEAARDPSSEEEGAVAAAAASRRPAPTNAQLAARRRRRRWSCGLLTVLALGLAALSRSCGLLICAFHEEGRPFEEEEEEEEAEVSITPQGFGGFGGGGTWTYPSPRAWRAAWDARRDARRDERLAAQREMARYVAMARNASRHATAAEQRAQEAVALAEDAEARAAAAEAKVDKMGDKVDRLEVDVDSMHKDFHAKDPDERLRADMRLEAKKLEDANAALEAELHAEARRVDGRLNVTQAQEAADALRAREDLAATSHEDRGYTDLKERFAEDHADTLFNRIQKSLGEYRVSTQVKFDSERDLIYHWIAGTFALLTFLISLGGVFAHSRKFVVPEVQRKILAILWMPPIYSLCCWVSLIYPTSTGGLAMVRDGYEAYTIWVFVAFLVSVVSGAAEEGTGAGAGDDDDDDDSPKFDEEAATAASAQKKMMMMQSPAAARLKNRRTGRSSSSDPYSRVIARLARDCSSAEGRPLPAAFCPPWGQPLARSFVRQCMVATLQFVLLKPIVGVAGYVVGVASDLNTPPKWVFKAKIGLIVIANISVTVAVSGLLKVYHATAHLLAAHNPWPKFCCVKGVVFVTFWQGTVIWALTRANALDGDLADAMQNFLICIEMFVASIVHSYVFSPDEWQPGFKAPPRVQVSDNLAVRDFIQDMRYVFTQPRRRRGRTESFSDYTGSHPASPEGTPNLSAGIDYPKETSSLMANMRLPRRSDGDDGGALRTDGDDGGAIRTDGDESGEETKEPVTFVRMPKLELAAPAAPSSGVVPDPMAPSPVRPPQLPDPAAVGPNDEAPDAAPATTPFKPTPAPAPTPPGYETLVVAPATPPSQPTTPGLYEAPAAAPEAPPSQPTMPRYEAPDVPPSQPTTPRLAREESEPEDISGLWSPA